MTIYLGEKAVGVGTVKATKAVAGDVLHDETLNGNGYTEPLGVDTVVMATTDNLNSKIAVVNAAIDGQADAIAKTRNDFEVADQNIRADMNEKDAELEHMITEHADELTTLRGNQASLGDQVSVIESKIPESASGTNHLVTKQMLLDEEMDIRDDLNESVSELQTQITAQASAIAGKQDKLIAGEGISIVDDVISATSAKSEWGKITGELSSQTDLQGALDAKQDKLTAGDGISIEGNVISNTRTNAEWGNITGDINNQTDLQDALGAKQDTLTAGANIRIEDNVISSTAQESFFRGRYADWANVPSNSTSYPADLHGDKTPTQGDYIVVIDSSDYTSDDFTDSFTFQWLGQGTGQVKITYNGIETIYGDGTYPIKNIGPDGCVTLASDNGQLFFNKPCKVGGNIRYPGEYVWINPSALVIYTSVPAGLYQGSWRFAYDGVWATNGKSGWKPEYQIEETLPIADETQTGIAKLYTATGTNTDGAMTQKATTDAISAHNTASNAHTNIRGKANGLATLDNNGKVPMAQINDSLLGNVSYQGLWNAEENVPYLPNPAGDLPEGYMQLKSIGSSNNGYIDTGVLLTGNVIKYSISFVGGSPQYLDVFGACYNNDWSLANSCAGALYLRSTSFDLRVGQTTVNNITANEIGVLYNVTITIDTIAKTYECIINDNRITGAYTGDITRDTSVAVFKSNSIDPNYFPAYNGQIQHFSIEQDGVLTCNLLAGSRTSDNAVGMYDTINDTFFTAVQGRFVAVEGDIQLPKGDYYIVSVAGDRFGYHYDVGDWIISTGEGWTKVDNTDAVVAVNGKTGNLTLTAGDVGAYTSVEIDAMIGDIASVLDAINGEGA